MLLFISLIVPLYYTIFSEFFVTLQYILEIKLFMLKLG